MNNEENNNKKLNRYVTRLVLIAGIIIMIASLEALMMAKSTDVFDAFIGKNPGMDFNQYISFIIVNFLSTIFEATLISLFTFFTYKKFGIKPIYKIVFGIIVLLKLVILTTKFQLDSVFYYSIIVLYIVFFITIVTAPIRERVKNDVFKRSNR